MNGSIIPRHTAQCLLPDHRVEFIYSCVLFSDKESCHTNLSLSNQVHCIKSFTAFYSLVAEGGSCVLWTHNTSSHVSNRRLTNASYETMPSKSCEYTLWAISFIFSSLSHKYLKPYKLFVKSFFAG